MWYYEYVVLSLKHFAMISLKLIQHTVLIVHVAVCLWTLIHPVAVLTVTIQLLFHHHMVPLQCTMPVARIREHKTTLYITYKLFYLF